MCQSPGGLVLLNDWDLPWDVAPVAAGMRCVRDAMDDDREVMSNVEQGTILGQDRSIDLRNDSLTDWVRAARTLCTPRSLCGIRAQLDGALPPANTKMGRNPMQLSIRHSRKRTRGLPRSSWRATRLLCRAL